MKPRDIPTTDSAVTIVYAESLTRPGLVRALRERRVSASMGFLDEPPDVRFWVRDGTECPTAMGGTLRSIDGVVRVRAEVWQDLVIAAARPDSPAISSVKVVGLSSAGEPEPVTYTTCFLSVPLVGCSCTNDPGAHGCSIDRELSVPNGPLWVEAYALDGTLILWSTAVYVNHCAYINAVGSGIPCTTAPLPIAPYMVPAP